MTRLAFIALAVLVAAALVPSLTLAKGPSEASIMGPGLAGPVQLPAAGEPSDSFWSIVDAVGFFPAVFGQSPDPMLSERPGGSLGPKYVMTYTVPGPNGEDDVLHQDVYPYAEPRPVVFTQHGQAFFVYQTTRGGWFVAKPSLKSALVAAGLPSSPPVSAPDGRAIS